MKCSFIILLFLFITAVISDQHLRNIGAFRKSHSTNDEPSPYACNRTTGISFTNVALINLNVTTTVYSSNEQINVTWSSISTVCADDFIGIYFTEVSFGAGTFFVAIKYIVVLFSRFSM